MKKLSFILLFACATFAASAQTKPKAATAPAKKEEMCKKGSACCKKCSDKEKTAAAKTATKPAVKKA